MTDIRLTSELLTDGLSPREIQAMCRAGELQRVRRGAYATPLPNGAGLAERHRRLVRATAPQLVDGAVISHGSAAILHGLPVWESAVQRVHVTRDRRGGSRRRAWVEVHGLPLAESEIVPVDGLLATSLARTAVDLARTVTFDRAVAAMDRALALGLTAEELAAALSSASRRPGMARARRVAAFADGRAESPGESLSRVRLHELRLPAPELQFDVVDDLGYLVGRSDFAWVAQRTLGEFDGRVKYGRGLDPGDTAENAVYREKLREDALRDLGWQVVRWVWADLSRPQAIADRVRRAFARAGG